MQGMLALAGDKLFRITVLSSRTIFNLPLRFAQRALDSIRLSGPKSLGQASFIRPFIPTHSKSLRGKPQPIILSHFHGRGSTNVLVTILRIYVQGIEPL